MNRWSLFLLVVSTLWMLLTLLGLALRLKSEHHFLKFVDSPITVWIFRVLNFLTFVAVVGSWVSLLTN